MNLEYFKRIIRELPVENVERYIFFVGDPELALKILGAGYRALVVSEENMSIDDFCEFVETNEFSGTYMMDMIYVPCLTSKKNKELSDFLREKAYTVNEGGTLFYQREYLRKIENLDELKDLIKEFIIRFEGTTGAKKNLDYYHLFNEKINRSELSISG